MLGRCRGRMRGNLRSGGDFVTGGFESSNVLKESPVCGKPAKEATALAFCDVSFRYVDEAEQEDSASVDDVGGSRVEGVSFEVRAGSCTVLCGRSGDGKSTVLRLADGLAGTFFPGVRTGSVLVRGTEVLSLSARGRTEAMGVVMQDPRSQFFMGTIGDEIAFSLENLGVDPAVIVEHMHEAARLCGVEGLLAEKLTELSSGQKQRVALAGAIACRPSLLVLDEPTSNLDAEGADALVSILARLKQRGVAILVSEHRLHKLLPVADEFLCMRNGKVASRWNVEEFATLPGEEADAFGLRHLGITIERDSNACPSELPDACCCSTSWRMEDVTYLYRSTGRGIRDVTAEFPCGAVTVVRGENGSGKTTLAKVLVGAARLQKGQITRDGKAFSSRKRRRLSYFVMQDADYQLYAGSVADEVVIGRRVDDALRARAWEALAAFDLEDLASRHPASLSGGQKQRVTLAAAYCSDAELVVLDEPTSGLDGRGMREVASWCRKLAAQGKAVVVITHDEMLARLAGDRTVELAARLERSEEI